MKIAYITSDEDRYLRSLIDSGLNIALVITNLIDSRVISLCKEKEVNCVFIDSNYFSERDEFDGAIMRELDNVQADLVILGGYRKIIVNGQFLDKYKGKMINVHNSFLPEFPGAKAHEQAFIAGAKESGYTIHYVEGEVDAGKILFQERVNIEECGSSQEVYDKLVEAGRAGLIETVNKLILNHNA